MSTRLAAIVLAALLLPQPAAPQPAPASGDPDLARGIRQASDGLYEAAVITLDSVARRLATQPTHASELARANLYLGVALAGVGDTQRARHTFRKALAADPGIRLDSPGSQKSAAVFAQAAGLLRSAWREAQVEDARRQWSSGVVAPQVLATPVAAPTRRGDEAKGGGGSKTALLVLGGVAVVGGGVAVLATRKSNVAPTASISVSPAGMAIPGVTILTLTASASDPDGDPITYQWSLGDGATGSGASVTHVYASEGSFSVALIASDGKGGSGSANASIGVRSLAGGWREAGSGTRLYQATQNGSSFTIVQTNDRGAGMYFQCTLRSPRALTGCLQFIPGPYYCARGCVFSDMVADPTLTRIELGPGSPMWLR